MRQRWKLTAPDFAEAYRDWVLSQIALPAEEGECWPWQGLIGAGGYGRCYIPELRQTGYAHRVVYELLETDIVEGMALAHICSKAHCVNPAHLRQITMADNLHARIWRKRT